MGSKGPNGGVVFKQKAASVRNPRTDAQMRNRAKMKLAAQVAGMLGDLGRISLVANGYRKGARGKLVKRLLGNVTISDNQALLNYVLHLIDNPNYSEAVTLNVTATTSAYIATFSGMNSSDIIAKAILVHDLTTGNWRHASAVDANTQITIGKASDESGHSMEVFAYGILLQPLTSDAYDAITNVAANTNGYIVDLVAGSASGYGFSPTISAALTIGSDGSSEGGNAGESGTQSGSGSVATVNAPTISGTNNFTTSTQVTMSADSGATIKYTTDGTAPSASNGQTYSGAITITATTTFRAVAILDGNVSSIANATFTKSSGSSSGNTLAAPVISTVEDGDSGAYSVTITAASGATIYYTTNDVEPSTSDTVYSGAFSVNYGTTIQAIAVLNGVTSSVATKVAG